MQINNESKFAEVFQFAKENIFDDREQFGEAVASKLYRHGYIYCNEEEVLNYIKGMLQQATITFDVESDERRKWTEYKVIIH